MRHAAPDDGIRSVELPPRVGEACMLSLDVTTETSDVYPESVKSFMMIMMFIFE